MFIFIFLYIGREKFENSSLFKKEFKLVLNVTDFVQEE